MREFLSQLRREFFDNPLAISWRIIVLPITSSLHYAAWVMVGVSQFIAHGKWKSFD
jgi:hypothetical protein